MVGRDAVFVGRIKALVRALLEQDDFVGRAELLAQVEGLEYLDGPATMMRLHVDRSYPPALGVPSPIRNGPSVVDDDGVTVGMMLLWLDDAGYIECLEYSWVTEEMPTQLPQPRQLVKWVR